MEWVEILKWVLIAVVVVVFIVCFMIVIIKRIKSGEKIDPIAIAVEFNDKLVESVELANDAFDKLSKAAGIPTGALKKDSALSKIKQFCEDKRVAFDEELWSTQIDKMVDLMNYEREKVQSTEPVTTDSNVKIDTVATKIRRDN